MSSARSTKLKILAIHGYRQSDKVFSAKLGSLRKSFKKEIDFVFIKAPHKVPPIEESDWDKEEANENKEDTEQFGWWFNTEDKVFKAVEPSNLSVGFEESVQLVEKTFEEQGPFDGLIGFSQGGSFVSILCAMQQKKILPIRFHFAIIVSGFKSLCKPHEIYYDEKLLLPTLHVFGDGDKVIPTKMARDLSNVFTNKQEIVHEGGHYVPGKKHIYDNFIKEMFKNICEENKSS
ncbi:candidate tumor suppressor in ovarian cancer 2 [Nasonia vitripennis]|uniref:Serine hydrolase domain-containing protein n=1 Tax=Nasonia vitripennis TaxID=7425 RepID=A0A7M6UCB5_NASVI|nr:candidate tumor suppressor in ovarian cancer 2 [Nasonia vitripennis]